MEQDSSKWHPVTVHAATHPNWNTGKYTDTKEIMFLLGKSGQVEWVAQVDSGVSNLENTQNTTGHMSNLL